MKNMAVNRINKFKALENHAWYGKYYNNLSKLDKHLIIEFLEKNSALNKNDFQFKINRILIDKTFDLPKKKIILINEMLTVANAD